MKGYAIKAWARHFESHESRRYSRPRFFPVRTDQDSRAFKRLMRTADGTQAFGLFIALAQMSTRLPRRGLLADERGPLSIRDLADKVGCPETLMRRAVKTLAHSDIGWLVAVETSDQNAVRLALDPPDDITGSSPGTPGERTGQSPGTNRDATGPDQTRPDQRREEKIPSQPVSNSHSPAQGAGGNGHASVAGWGASRGGLAGGRDREGCRRTLEDLDLRDPKRKHLLDSGCTTELVLQMWPGVKADKSATNKPMCLYHRLCERLGVQPIGATT